MYELRPIITFDSPIEFPTCMYIQKSIHDDEENGHVDENLQDCTKIAENFKQVEQFIKNIENKEMAELEERQEKLLGQLEELKKIMQSIKCELMVTDKNTSSLLKTSTKIPCKVQRNIPDIVINANPNYPPYFLLFLQQSLRKEINLNINCYLHSSITNISSITEDFVSNLRSSQINGIPSVDLRLIWKEIGQHAELYVSHYPIQGEANILRYLVRILDSGLNHEKYASPEEIDYLLDMSYVLSYNSKNNKNYMQYLNKSSSKGLWLDGRSSITIADIAVFDFFKKHVKIDTVSSNLRQWFAQCEKYIKS